MTAGGDADRIFRALGDPTRRAILVFLAEGRRPVGEIAERFPMSRPAISKHLRLLKEAGLVDERRKGRKRLYGVAVAALRPVGGWLDRVGLDRIELGRVASGRFEPQRPESPPREHAARRPAAATIAENHDDEDWRSW